MSNISSETKYERIAENHCDTNFEPRKCTFSWTIGQYSMYKERCDRIDSSSFSAVGDDFEWNLTHAVWREKTTEYVAIGLRYPSRENLLRYGPVSGNVVISMITPGLPDRKFEKKSFTFTTSTTGWAPLGCDCISTVLFNELNERTFEDKLKIFCELTYSKRTDIINIPTSSSALNPIEIPETSLSRDFERILIDKHFSDVTISVGGKNYPGHKAILASRSSVFNEMLRNEMKESKKNHIVITDMDQKIFEEVLYFIYTGKTGNLEESAFEVLPVADKYDLKDLRIMCENVLFKKLSTDNAARILILADMHNAEDLKAHTLRFIKVNNSKCKDFKKTEVWKVVTKSRPKLMEDMLNVFFHG